MADGAGVANDGGNDAYLTGLYAPVSQEVTAANLPVVGELPARLDGVFVQNMPNPAFAPGVGHSWFDGDGMVHGVEFRDGTATYRNRWIETQGLREDRAAGHATYIGSLARPGAGKRHKNTANTDLIWHAGRLLALWWEGGEPYELSLPDLKTLGPYDYNGTLGVGLNDVPVNALGVEVIREVNGCCTYQHDKQRIHGMFLLLNPRVVI